MIKGIRSRKYKSGAGKTRYSIEVTTDNTIWTPYTHEGKPYMLTREHEVLIVMSDILKAFASKMMIPK